MRVTIIIAVYIVPVTGTLTVVLGYWEREIFTIHVNLHEKFPKKCNPKSSPNLTLNFSFSNIIVNTEKFYHMIVT